MKTKILKLNVIFVYFYSIFIYILFKLKEKPTGRFDGFTAIENVEKCGILCTMKKKLYHVFYGFSLYM